MNKNRHNLWHPVAGLLLLALAAGCGTPGAPQPPSLQLPKPVDDLKAVRKGDKVFLHWSAPSTTTDSTGIKKPGITQVCRGLLPSGECKEVAAEMPALPAPAKGAATDDLTPLLKDANLKLDFLSYAVLVKNPRSRGAGPSNLATVFLAPSVPAPAEVKTTLRPDSIAVQFTAPPVPESPALIANFFYRVMRRSLDGAPVMVAEAKATPGVHIVEDRNFEWEKPYRYWVTGRTRVLSREGGLLAEFEGEDSHPAEILAHDVFPPAAPAGVQAVFTAVDARKFIDLSWSPNEEADLAGYIVFRRENDGAAARMNSELLKTPAFRDEKVAAGKSYAYSVIAVDDRGNESPPSPIATENTPE